MKTKQILLLITCVLLLSSCADRQIVENCVSGHVYGFWGGLWHGFIMIFDLVGMLFWDDVTIYATNNNGGWYALGFFIGVNITIGNITKLFE